MSLVIRKRVVSFFARTDLETWGLGLVGWYQGNHVPLELFFGPFKVGLTVWWDTEPFFGDPWDDPLIRLKSQGPTPVGKDCGLCGIPIRPGDEGVQLYGREESGEIALEPFHRDCFAELPRNRPPPDG